MTSIDAPLRAFRGALWLVFWAFLFYGIYTLLGVLVEWKDARDRSLYADCVERGGTVTEGGMGRSCVGVRTPGKW